MYWSSFNQSEICLNQEVISFLKPPYCLQFRAALPLVIWNALWDTCSSYLAIGWTCLTHVMNWLNASVNNSETSWIDDVIISVWHSKPSMMSLWCHRGYFLRPTVTFTSETWAVTLTWLEGVVLFIQPSLLAGAVLIIIWCAFFGWSVLSCSTTSWCRGEEMVWNLTCPLLQRGWRCLLHWEASPTKSEPSHMHTGKSSWPSACGGVNTAVLCSKDSPTQIQLIRNLEQFYFFCF